MKTNNRLSRINDEIMKELSQIIRAELKDPRIGVMTSVIRVETTQDLKYCKVYVSVLGDEKDKENVMKGLQNAGGFIRRLIAQRINLRYTPELRFKLDESAEYAIHMDELFSKIWDMESIGDIATVTVHIKKIREKIEFNTAKPQYIETIWGVGYRFKV